MSANKLKDVGLKSINMVILGREGAGKTTIFKQMHAYFKTKYPDTKRTNNRMEIKNDTARVTIHDIDLPATLNDICMYSVRSKGDVFILVYAIHDNESFEYVAKIKDYLIRPTNKTSPTITIIGNKKDLNDRAMPHEVVDCLVCIDWELSYLEVSAINEHAGDTVPEILRCLIPRNKQAPLLPVGDELDTFELRGIQFRRRSHTDVRENYKPVTRNLHENITEEVILPKTVEKGKLGRRVSLPSYLHVRCTSSCKNSGNIGAVKPDDVQETIRRHSLFSQLFLCLKYNQRDSTEGKEKNKDK